MVAYSYKAFFAPQIASGIKRQTVRADRRRHARPGELVQHYTGMRTRHCLKIRPDTICTAVLPIVIGVSTLIDDGIASIELDGTMLHRDEIEEFARADGFAPEHFNALAFGDGKSARANMGRFWLENHPGKNWFNGVVIRWRDASTNMME